MCLSPVSQLSGMFPVAAFGCHVRSANAKLRRRRPRHRTKRARIGRVEMPPRSASTKVETMCVTKEPRKRARRTSRRGPNNSCSQLECTPATAKAPIRTRRNQEIVKAELIFHDGEIEGLPEKVRFWISSAVDYLRTDCILIERRPLGGLQGSQPALQKRNNTAGSIIAIVNLIGVNHDGSAVGNGPRCGKLRSPIESPQPAPESDDSLTRAGRE